MLKTVKRCPACWLLITGKHRKIFYALFNGIHRDGRIRWAYNRIGQVGAIEDNLAIL